MCSSTLFWEAWKQRMVPAQTACLSAPVTALSPCDGSYKTKDKTHHSTCRTPLLRSGVWVDAADDLVRHAKGRPPAIHHQACPQLSGILRTLWAGLSQSR